MGRTHKRDGTNQTKKYKRSKKATKKIHYTDDKEKSKEEGYFWWDNQDNGGKNDFERFSGNKKH
tara:strand:+ start:109 stop:300 length:192 start_codon:yes stop_codon:yes gene_type:complete